MAENKDEKFFVKLDELQARYNEIDRLISDQAVASDPNKFVPLAKEQGKLRAIVTKYVDYKKIVADSEDEEIIRHYKIIKKCK